jgi:hypothetical protein
MPVTNDLTARKLFLRKHESDGMKLVFLLHYSQKTGDHERFQI